MKKHRLAVANLAVFFSVTSARAVPEFKIGDNAELFLTTAASVAYDNNIFLGSSAKTDETIFDFAPGIDLPFGALSEIGGDAFAKVDFLEYADHSGQDAVLPDFGFVSNYDEGKTKVAIGASYQELAQNNAAVRLSGIVVHTDSTSGKIYGESGVTEDTSVGAGVNYGDTTYSQPGFISSSTWSVPVDVYYSFSPKTEVSAGYRYTISTQGGGAADYHDDFFNVGLRGEFSPLVTGQIRLGYDELQYANGGGSRSLPGVEGDFTFTANEKMSWVLTIANQYANSGIGVVTKNFVGGISGKTDLDPQWEFVPSLNWSHVNYSGTSPERSDDILTGSAGIVYVYAAYANVGLTYSLSDDRSNISGIGYADARLILALNLRY
jgi:hypothetical protein